VSFAALIQKMLQQRDGVTVSTVPALTPDDELTLRGLSRVMEEYTGLPRHAALRMGEVVPPFANRESSVSVQVLKPCKRGVPLSTVTFRGRTVAEAAHEAKRFVESILPCEDQTEE